MRIPRTQTVLIVGLLGAVILLAGCSTVTHSSTSTASGSHSGSSAHATPSVSASPKPVPTPTPTAVALAPNAIVRITATVTASTGQVARLVETVLAPAAADGSEAAAMSNAGCNGSDWPTQFPHPSWTHVSVVATVVSGGSWPGADPILTSSGGYWGYAAWTGQVEGFEAPCSDEIQDIPGTSAAIVPADPTAAALSHASATGGPFGFDWASDADDPSDMHFSFTGCTIEIGPAAGAAATALVRQPAIDGYPQMCSTAGP